MSKTVKSNKTSSTSNSQGRDSKSKEEFSDEREVNDLKVFIY